MKIQTKLIGLLSFCGCLVLVSVAINWIGLSKLSGDIAEMTKQDHINSEHMIDHMQEMQTLHRKSQTLINIVSTVCMISIVTAVIIGIVIIRDIVNSLNKAVAIAKEISAGNLTPQVEFTSDDEIGQLLKTLKFMTINLNSLMSKVQQSGFQITRSTKQMAASGKQLEATVTEQLASTNQVTATAQTIAATSEELVKTMDQVAQLAHRTAHGASQSQKDLEQMEKSMRLLIEATRSISQQLGVMNEKANNINSVVTTINKVADQTNLLGCISSL